MFIFVHVFSFVSLIFYSVYDIYFGALFYPMWVIFERKIDDDDDDDNDVRRYHLNPGRGYWGKVLSTCAALKLST